MEYYNFSKSVRLLSIKTGRGVRVVALNVGKGVLSEADKEAVVVGNKPTAEALMLAKNGLVDFNQKVLTALFKKTQKTDSYFTETEDKGAKAPEDKGETATLESERPE
jgi:hypothetical protein